MDIIKVADKIEAYIEQIEKCKDALRTRSDARAEAIGAYEKQLGITIMKLKNGIEFTLDDTTIKEPPVTITERVARAICFQEKITMEQTETEYKNLTKGIDAFMACLNGWQSIYKHLPEK